MPSPSEHSRPEDELQADLARRAPQPSGDPAPAFLSAVRARRREVRARRAAGAVIAAAVALTAWQLLPDTPPQQIPSGPVPVAEGPGPAEPQSASLASLRRIYTQPGEGPLALPELPVRQATGPEPDPVTLLDSRRLLAGGA